MFFCPCRWFGLILLFSVSKFNCSNTSFIVQENCFCRVRQCSCLLVCLCYSLSPSIFQNRCWIRNIIKTGPAAFLWNYLSCAKTKREEERKSCGLVLLLTSFYHWSLTVCSTVGHHLCPWTWQLHPHFYVFSLWHTHITWHTLTHTYAGGDLAGQGSQAGSKAVCEGARVPRRKQLPLAVSASHPSLTAARNMRPLQTSVLGKKKDRTAHIHSEKLLSLLSLSLSLTHPGIQRRKKAVCLCSFTHSATNRNLRFTYTLPLPTSQNH